MQTAWRKGTDPVAQKRRRLRIAEKTTTGLSPRPRSRRKTHRGRKPDGVNVRAVDAAKRLVRDSECRTLDGAHFAGVGCFVAVQVKKFSVRKDRDGGADSILGCP